MPFCPNCAAELEREDLQSNQCWNCEASFGVCSEWKPTPSPLRAFQPRRIEAAVQVLAPSPDELLRKSAEAQLRERSLDRRFNALIPPKAISFAVALVLISSLLSFVPSLSTEASHALRGVASVCVGIYGLIWLVFCWWHRLPIRIKGGLSSERPFFYHAGFLLFASVGLVLVIGGASLVVRWGFR